MQQNLPHISFKELWDPASFYCILGNRNEEVDVQYKRGFKPPPFCQNSLKIEDVPTVIPHSILKAAPYGLYTVSSRLVRKRAKFANSYMMPGSKSKPREEFWPSSRVSAHTPPHAPACHRPHPFPPPHPPHPCPRCRGRGDDGR